LKKIGTAEAKIVEPSQDLLSSIAKYREIEDEVARYSAECCKQYDTLVIIDEMLDREILGYDISRNRIEIKIDDKNNNPNSNNNNNFNSFSFDLTEYKEEESTE